MPWNDKRSAIADQSEETIFDDGGTGLTDACVKRFAEFGWTIKCDARQTVWVTDVKTTFSIGLSSWMFDRFSIDEMLDDVESRMKKAQTRI